MHIPRFMRNVNRVFTNPREPGGVGGSVRVRTLTFPGYRYYSPGMIVDAATGVEFQLKPERIDVKLSPLAAH